MHALLHTDVGKYRFDNAEPSGVDLLSLIGIDLGLHLIDQVRRLRMHWDGKIPARGGWFAQTAHLQRTGGAVCDTGVEYDPLSVNEYQAKYQEQQVKYMKKRAAKFGYQLIPV